jgi:hypothetical protein
LAFPWAGFRKTKGSIKLHTLLDLKGNIPSFKAIKPAGVHKINNLDELIAEAGAICIMDRGYLDFERFYAWHQCALLFIVRARAKMQLRRLCSMPVDKSFDLRCNQIVVKPGFILESIILKNFIVSYLSIPIKTFC